MMRPVKQTRLHDPDPNSPPGNCFQAVVASILEFDEIPDEIDHWKPGMTPRESWEPWLEAFRAWLEMRGFAYLEVSVGSSFDAFGLLGVVCEMSGPSPRDPGIRHSVVARWTSSKPGSIGPVIVHDPHPSNDGLLSGERGFGFFLPIDPGEVIR